MPNSGLTIECATPEDVAGIRDLQERNMLENGGMLSVRWSREWFEAAIAEMPIIVARDGHRIVGYVVSTPLLTQSGSPIVQGMLRAYPRSPGAYIYGPICVADSHRQQGLAMAMFEELRKQLPNREGFTFIRCDNAVSRAVHTRMGMREVAEFTQGDIAYVVVAYNG
jgi:predicted N-acetyltransferase YhbS